LFVARPVPERSRRAVSAQWSFRLRSTTAFRYERSSTQRPRFDTPFGLLNDRRSLSGVEGPKCRWLSRAFSCPYRSRFTPAPFAGAFNSFKTQGEIRFAPPVLFVLPVNLPVILPDLRLIEADLCVIPPDLLLILPNLFSIEANLRLIEIDL